MKCPQIAIQQSNSR